MENQFGKVKDLLFFKRGDYFGLGTRNASEEFFVVGEPSSFYVYVKPLQPSVWIKGCSSEYNKLLSLFDKRKKKEFVELVKLLHYEAGEMYEWK